MRSTSTKMNILTMMNNPFWKKISKAEEDPDLYLPDGLHLNPEGKEALVKDWYPQLLRLI